MTKLDNIRKAMTTASTGIDDNTLTPTDILDPKEKNIDEKVKEVRRRHQSLKIAKSRSKKLSTANAVFGDFAKDAAEGKVTEMILGSTSSDRQRAQETILDRALGKAVDRSMNINVEISNLNSNEMDNKIHELLNGLYQENAEGREGAVASLIIDEEASSGSEPVEEPEGESGVPSSVREE